MPASSACTCLKDNYSTTNLLLVRVKEPRPMHHAVQVTYKCKLCGGQSCRTYELFANGKEAEWHYYDETEIIKVIRTSTRSFSYAHVQDCFDAMWSEFDFRTANCGDWAMELWDRVEDQPESVLFPSFEYFHVRDRLLGKLHSSNDKSIGEQFKTFLTEQKPRHTQHMSVDEKIGLLRKSIGEVAGQHAERCRDWQILFRPPVEMVFRGDWDQTLQAARQKNVWLLVNVQNATEFASAVLNRDIWSAEAVKEVIQQNFLFWQVYHDTSDAIRIHGYYGFDTYPAIFILDPRTGEKVLKLQAPDPVTFLDNLTTFLAHYPTFEDRDQQFRQLALQNGDVGY